MKVIRAAFLTAALCFGANTPSTSPEYAAGGSLLFPSAYREWSFVTSGLGMTYATPAASDASPNFDNVFVQPSAYQAFLRTGSWPDKTVLILEVRASDSKVSINRDGHVQSDVLRVEAHVKDAARGGWAFYSFDQAQKGRASLPPPAPMIPRTANCYSCHQQNGAVDSTFVQFYPTLIETARAHGTLLPAAR